MAWRSSYYFGKIKINVKADDIRKVVLLHNFARNTRKIVDKFLDISDNSCRDTFRVDWTNFVNPNFNIFYPDREYSDALILIWECCNGYQVIYSEDLFLYKEADMCSNCIKLLDDIFKELQTTSKP
ncbi:UNVERIFIED_CONTAM: hypothetical protein RMT77_002243 [Armadillidium vulgare]